MKRSAKYLVPARTAGERFASAVTLRQIRYFIAVAETGKVSTAAAMVGISPSAVTEAVAELEAIAGVALFRRHPRGLDLTYEGHRLLAHGRYILSAVEGAGLAISRADSGMAGEITLATTITVIGYFLAPFLARFRRTFPNIAVRVVEARRPEVEAGLVSGAFDLALMLVSNLENRQALLSHAMVHSMRRLWLPHRHRLLRQEVVTLADVAREPYIQLMIDDAPQSTGTYWQEHGAVRDIVMRTESVEAIRSMIAHGHGVTILSDMMYRPWSLEGDRIEVRELAANIPSMTTGVAWRRDGELSPAARTFLDFCRTESDGGQLEARRNMPVERE
jgi:DNA-binding transcriptional LysR family regulator